MYKNLGPDLEFRTSADSFGMQKFPRRPASGGPSPTDAFKVTVSTQELRILERVMILFAFISDIDHCKLQLENYGSMSSHLIPCAHILDFTKMFSIVEMPV